MKKIYALVIGGLFAGAVTAQNVNVTFRVDMTGQTVGTGVFVAGDFQGPAGGSNWNATGTPMTQVGATTVYQATVSIPQGQYEFKFINGSNWENVPAICQKEYGTGNSNRVTHVFSDTTLPAIVYEACAPVNQSYLMFRADMTSQTIDPLGVFVAGDFQSAAGFAGNWQAGTTRLFNYNNNGIYCRAVYVPNATYEYKFINGTNWESVPAGCAVNNNRQVVLTGNQLLDVTPYGGCASVAQQYNVTFRIDMSTTCIPFDSVDVAGGAINGWAGGDMLLDPDGDDIYELTIPIFAGPVVFKFRAIVGGNANWEGIPDRNITVSGDTTLPLACFNVAGFNSCPAVPAPADVTFRVDMSNEVPASAIYVIGDFTVPAWQQGAIQLTPSPGNPGVFETTITGFCPATFFYKFVNGDVNNTANEESFTGLDTVCVVPSGVGGFNRFFERTNGNAISLQYVFGKCETLNIGVEENFATKNFGISPNPMSDVAKIQLQDDQFYNLTIRDLSGRTIRSIHQVNGLVEIARNDLASGVYILQIENQNGELNNSKFSVK